MDNKVIDYMRFAKAPARYLNKIHLGNLSLRCSDGTMLFLKVITDSDTQYTSVKEVKEVIEAKEVKSPYIGKREFERNTHKHINRFLAGEDELIIMSRGKAYCVLSQTSNEVVNASENSFVTMSNAHLISTVFNKSRERLFGKISAKSRESEKGEKK